MPECVSAATPTSYGEARQHASSTQLSITPRLNRHLLWVATGRTGLSPAHLQAALQHAQVGPSACQGVARITLWLVFLDVHLWVLGAYVALRHILR